MTFKRILIGLIAVVILVGAIGWMLRDRIAEVLFTRIAQSVVSSNVYDELPDGLHVFFCGTGSPTPDPTRTGTCNGVVAGERIFLVDIAAGGLRNLMLSQFPVSEIERVYITHLHLDHIVGLGDLMIQYWMDGATSPLQVSGPEGVEVMVDGFNLAYSPDRQYRLDFQPDTLDPNGYGFEATTINLTDKNAVILEEEDLKITVFEVNHYPVEPAFGFRFDYKDRSVVFSGDTVYDENLIENSVGADLLIHEAMSIDMLALLAGQMEPDGHDHTKDTLDHAADIHTTPVEAATAAQKAGVQELLLNHIVPPVPSSFLNGLFLGDAEEHFDGKITVGEDLMIVSLPAQSDEIIHH